MTLTETVFSKESFASRRLQWVVEMSARNGFSDVGGGGRGVQRNNLGGGMVNIFIFNWETERLNCDVLTTRWREREM